MDTRGNDTDTIDQLVDEPLTLEQLLNALVFLPVDDEEQVCDLSMAYRLRAYRAAEPTGRSRPQSMDDGQRQALLDHALVRPTRERYYYPFAAAAGEITLKQFLVISKHLSRVPWEDLVIRRGSNE